MRRFARVALLFLGCGVCSLLYGVSQLALSLEQEAGGARQRQARESAAPGGGRQAGSADGGEEGAGRYGPGPRVPRIPTKRARGALLAGRGRPRLVGDRTGSGLPRAARRGRAVPLSELGCREGLFGCGAAAGNSVNSCGRLQASVPSLPSHLCARC